MNDDSEPYDVPPEFVAWVKVVVGLICASRPVGEGLSCFALRLEEVTWAPVLIKPDVVLYSTP